MKIDSYRRRNREKSRRIGLDVKQGRLELGVVLKGTWGMNMQASITADASSSCSAVWLLGKTFCFPPTDRRGLTASQPIAGTGYQSIEPPGVATPRSDFVSFFQLPPRPLPPTPPPF